MGAPPYRDRHGGDGDPWRARVCDGRGLVLGAGIVLDHRHVLTCAHVLPPEADPNAARSHDWPVRVDVVGRLPVRSCRARVHEHGWQPLAADPDHAAEGDVALLELAEPLDGMDKAPLYQLALRRDMPVWAYGFRRGEQRGLWVKAVVGGHSGELVQIDATDEHRASVDHGFSGAGVVDERGRVVGMVSAKLAGRPGSAGIAWMAPIDTIAHYLPMLARYVSVAGVPRTDPSLLPFGLGAGDPRDARAVRAVRTILDQLGTLGHGLLAFAGEQGGSRSAVTLAALLADPATRAGLPEWLRRGTEVGGTEVGGIDIAVNAAGRTTEELTALIGQRLGHAAHAPPQLLAQITAAPTPFTVVVVDIDAAADREGLLTDLLLPLAEATPGARVLVDVSEDRPISVRGVTTVYMPPPSAVSEETARRLAELERAVTALAGAEASALRQAADFTGPGLVEKATKRRMDLYWLARAVDRGADQDELSEHLDRVERKTRRALRRAEQSVARGPARDELRHRIDVFKLRAARAGLAEESAISASYEHAHQLLWRSPCDLVAAGQAAEEFLAAVWRGLGHPPPDTDEPPPDPTADPPAGPPMEPPS